MEPTRPRLTAEELRSALDLLNRDFSRPLAALRDRLVCDLATDAPSRGMLDALCDDLLTLPDAFRRHALLACVDRDVALGPMWLGELLRIVDDRLADDARARNHDWQVILQGPDDEVVSDLEACLEVLSHVASNAIRYAPPGAAIRVAAGRDPASWWMSVTDTGPGIPATDRERMFEPFQRLPRETRLGIPGAGLGLATCRVLTKKLGGVVLIDEPDGFEFRVAARFPCETID